MSKKEQIIEEIRKIYDPELPVNIYELGLIYDIKVKDEKFAIIKMTLTTPNCPVAESLPKEVKDGAMQVEGIEDVDLELVWDPPWNKDMMSEASDIMSLFQGGSQTNSRSTSSIPSTCMAPSFTSFGKLSATGQFGVVKVILMMANFSSFTLIS